MTTERTLESLRLLAEKDAREAKEAEERHQHVYDIQGIVEPVILYETALNRHVGSSQLAERIVSKLMEKYTLIPKSK